MFRSQESGHRPGKFFYLQDPGETERWLGPRPHPLWGPWEEGNGRARPENRDPSHFSFPVSHSLSGPLATSPCPSLLCSHIWDKNSCSGKKAMVHGGKGSSWRPGPCSLPAQTQEG